MAETITKSFEEWVAEWTAKQDAMISMLTKMVQSQSNTGSERSRSDSALKIQKVLRGFLVRKSVKKIIAMRREVNEIEKRLLKKEVVELIQSNMEEKLKVKETLENLLFDSVRGFDSRVRDCWTIFLKVIGLQKKFDAIVSGEETVDINIFAPIEEDDNSAGIIISKNVENDSADFVDSEQLHDEIAQGMRNHQLGFVEKITETEISDDEDEEEKKEEEGKIEEIDVSAYTSMITVLTSNGRYREAGMIFIKMEEEGCKPTLITCDVFLNVYGKMGMPWNMILVLVDGKKTAGITSDLYTYNTLISRCRQGSLYEEAAQIFEEMEEKRFNPDKITYNALFDVYGKSQRTKEAMDVLKEMEASNSLISACAGDGLWEVVYIGSLKVEVGLNEQDDVSHILLDKFKCVPVFLPAEILQKFYHDFCKQHLWPWFHYMRPFPANPGRQFDRSLWEAYVAANKIFSQKVTEVINPKDYVWIHYYHLMVLPTFLRRRFNRLSMGFFLHSPFSSSEIYRTLSVREEILKALLNSDLIGFHTFHYARHFLSCCSRMLGLEYQSKRGYIGLEYCGRTVGIKIMPVGIHMRQIETVSKQADKEWRVEELKQQFEGKVVMLGVDDMDIFKGVNLKLLTMEHMLKQHPKWQGRAKDLEEIQAKIRASCKRINDSFRQPNYEPIVFIDRPVSLRERAAYFTIAECVVVTAVRDGMNLTPYEYIECRQGLSEADSTSELSGPKKSTLVVSEFIGCSPSLSGAIRVNPWNIETTAEAMNEAISMSDTKKQLRHEKHYRYISTHHVAYWSKSFFKDMEKTCKEHFRRRCWGMGLSFGFRVVALDPNFRKLSSDASVSAYIQSENRAVLLDYDGTVMPQTSINKAPTQEVLTIINTICGDVKNSVFTVSGRGRDRLGKWFSPCKKLGIAAEHGYFMRWSAFDEWKNCGQSDDFGWMQIAEPVLKLYTDATDGSAIEAEESALVWHHRDADPEFGSSQAKELLDHLESVLANEPVAVKSDQFIIEVKPQGVSKGMVAEKIFSSTAENGRQADFVLCIGDDRSDEGNNPVNVKVFALGWIIGFLFAVSFVGLFSIVPFRKRGPLHICKQISTVQMLFKVWKRDCEQLISNEKDEMKDNDKARKWVLPGLQPPQVSENTGFIFFFLPIGVDLTSEVRRTYDSVALLIFILEDKDILRGRIVMKVASMLGRRAGL